MQRFEEERKLEVMNCGIFKKSCSCHQHSAILGDNETGGYVYGVLRMSDDC